MAISTEEVQYIAKLARLELTDEETTVYGKQLNDILMYMEKLKELDTDSVSPTLSVVPSESVFRKDEVIPSLDTEDALINGPDTNDNFYKVPKIIE